MADKTDVGKSPAPSEEDRAARSGTAPGVRPVFRQPPPEQRPTKRIVCTLPSGLRLQRYRKSDSPDMNMVPVGDPVFLNGANSSGPGGERVAILTPGAKGITEVDAEWWDKWSAENAEDDGSLLGGTVYEDKAPEPAPDRAA